MELKFNTRDTELDYPLIGWLPPCPNEGLWKQFGNWQNQNHQQIILFQKNGIWELFISALNSNRTDYTGTRIIRVNLYLTGTCDENIDSLRGLLTSFIRDVLNSGNHNPFVSIFKDAIVAGEPEKWRDASQEEQQEAARKLLGLLQEQLVGTWPECDDPKEDLWSGGCQTCAEPFLARCKSLLVGEKEGIATTLAWAHEENFLNVFQRCGEPSTFALLLTVKDDINKTLKTFEKPKVETEPEPEPETKQETDCSDCVQEATRRQSGGSPIAGAAIGAVFGAAFGAAFGAVVSWCCKHKKNGTSSDENPSEENNEEN